MFQKGYKVCEKEAIEKCRRQGPGDLFASGRASFNPTSRRRLATTPHRKDKSICIPSYVARGGSEVVFFLSDVEDLAAPFALSGAVRFTVDFSHATTRRGCLDDSGRRGITRTVRHVTITGADPDPLTLTYTRRMLTSVAAATPRRHHMTSPRLAAHGLRAAYTSAGSPTAVLVSGNRALPQWSWGASTTRMCGRLARPGARNNSSHDVCSRSSPPRCSVLASTHPLIPTSTSRRGGSNDLAIQRSTPRDGSR